MGAELVGISVDGVWCHAAFAAGAQAALPAARRLRAEGRGRADLRRLSRRRRHGERGAVRDRRGRRDPLELRVARSRQPRRRRHSRALEALRTNRTEDHELESRRVAGRSRAGTGDRAGHARRVRRLRVPVLRPRLPDRQGRAGDSWARSCASSSATSRYRGASARASRGRSRRSRGRAGQVLGDARRAVRASAIAQSGHGAHAGPARSAWT